MKKTKERKNTSIRNKKGFTLIEIIAVIVILGIIIVVSGLSVSGYVADTKRKTYESYKKDLKGAAENYLIDCMSNNEESCDIPIPRYGIDEKLSYNYLESRGYTERLKDPEGEGYCDRSYVIASNKSSSGVNIEYKVCLYCENYKSEDGDCKETFTNDTTPPTCGEVKGESEEWTKEDKVITVGCNDAGDGCLRKEFSKRIGKEDEAITDALITIEDKAGNKESCPVKAYVDKKAPTCKIEVDQITADGWYKPGVTARVVEMYDEGSGVASYGIGTSLTRREYNGRESYTVHNGIVTIFGYVKDEVGNEGYCSKEIKVDNTNPEGVLYMGYEIYPKENGMIQSNKLTVQNIEKYGNIEGLIIYFSGATRANGTIKVDGKKGGYIDKNGAVIKGKDKAIIKLEKGTYEELIITAEAIRDTGIKRVELLKKENITSVWTNKDVSVYVEANDTITGVGGYSYDGGRTYQESNIKTYSEDTTGTVVIKDQVSNLSEEYPFTINKIDKVKPNCTLEVKAGEIGKNLWYISNSVSIGFATHTDDRSGVDTYYIDGEEGKKITTITNDTKKENHEGTIIDIAGNENTCNIEIKKDATKPTCALEVTSGEKGSNNWYISDVNVGFKTANDATSGVKKYGIGDYTGDKVKTLSTDTKGVTYTGYIEDDAGNSDSCTINIKRDTVKPDCNLVVTDGTLSDTGWYTTNVTIGFNKASDTTSGVETYSVNGRNSVVLATDAKEMTYVGTIKDYAGHENSCKISVRRDATKPSCALEVKSGTTGDNGWYKSDVQVGFKTATDATSGVSTNGIGSVTGSKTATLSTDSTGTTYTGHIKDEAGNTNTCTIKIKRDTVAPSCTLEVKSGTLGDNSWYKTDVKVGFKEATDATSGVSTNAIGDYTGDKTKTLSTDTSSKKYTGYIKDNAGHTSSCTITIKRDATNPSCALEVTSGTLGANSWYKSDVQVGFKTATDATSGVSTNGIGSATGSKTTTLSTDSTGTTYTGHIKDKAGNTNTCTINIKRDTTKPTLTVTAYKCSNSSCSGKTGNSLGSSSTNGGSINIGWKNYGIYYEYSISESNFNKVDISWNSYGDYSGPSVSSTPGASYTTKTGSNNLTAEGYRKIKFTAYDKAGNSTVVNSTVKIDKTAPKFYAHNPSSYLTQWDNNGNVFDGASLWRQLTCTSSGCSNSLGCLINQPGSFSVYDPGITFNDNSGENVTIYSDSIMYDRYGNEATTGCLWTEGDNPCTWKIFYTVKDKAENALTFPISHTIEYNGYGACR